MKKTTELYVVRVFGCVEPELFGPFKNALDRLTAAQELQDDDSHAIFRLDIVNGKPSVRPFSGAEMEAK